MFGIYWRIAIPLALPAMATLAVFMFLYYWNDLFYPLIFLTKERLMIVPIGILAMQGMGAMTDGDRVGWSAMLASAVLAIVPTLIVYILAQRYFVQGIATTGLKG